MVAARTWRLQHLLILLATIALLPLLVASVWAIQSTIRQHRLEVERSALDLSRALATAVAAELESTAGSLRTLSQSQSLADADLHSFYVTASRVQKTNPYWQGVVLTDEKGRMLFNTSRPYGDNSPVVVDPASLRTAMNSSDPVVGSVVTGPRGNTAYPVRIPIRRGGELSYVLTAAVYPERMLNMLRQQKVPADWVVAVFDSSGQRVARTREHQSRAPSPTLAKMLAGSEREGVGTTTTLEGMDVITGFTRVHGSRWTVAVAIPSAGTGDIFLRSGVLYLAGILGSLLAWAVAASWLARRIANSVEQLKERAIGLVRKGRTLSPARSHIREIAEADVALVAMSQLRADIDAERNRLLGSLNESLAATRLALSRAEEAGRSKDNFLAMLGHELRNPLAPIVSALDLLDLRGSERDAKERAILRRQVDRLRRLVDDLFDVSRIAQGKLQVNRQPQDLRETVRAVWESVQDVAWARATRVDIDLPDSPVIVDGDALRLEQVISNLLINALDFAAGRITLALAVQDQQAVVVVEDNGAGMDRHTLENLFQPFYQAPQSIERSRGGLGLGLTIVQSIVELHGGEVHADSGGAGKGSRFEVRLPLGRVIERQALTQDRVEPVGQRRVLVVDDNVDAAELIAACLQAMGHQVHTEHSGAAALAAMASFEPEIAILDIGMPEMDGYQLVQEIRARHPAWSGRLFALSGYGQAQDKDRATAAGFDLHLTKPVQIEALNEALNEAINEAVSKQ